MSLRIGWPSGASFIGTILTEIVALKRRASCLLISIWASDNDGVCFDIALIESKICLGLTDLVSFLSILSSDEFEREFLCDII